MSVVVVTAALVILAIFIILRIVECVVRSGNKKKLHALFEQTGRETRESPIEF